MCVSGDLVFHNQSMQAGVVKETVKEVFSSFECLKQDDVIFRYFCVGLHPTSRMFIKFETPCSFAQNGRPLLQKSVVVCCRYVVVVFVVAVVQSGAGCGAVVGGGWTYLLVVGVVTVFSY